MSPLPVIRNIFHEFVQVLTLVIFLRCAKSDLLPTPNSQLPQERPSQRSGRLYEPTGRPIRLFAVPAGGAASCDWVLRELP